MSTRERLKKAEYYLDMLDFDLAESEKDNILCQYTALLEELTVEARNSVRHGIAGRKNAGLAAAPYPLDKHIFFEIKGSILIISIDRLIPWKRSGRVNVQKYYDSLYREPFEDFAKDGNYKMPDRYVLWYKHYYRDIYGRDVLDHDNIETKVMTDLISKYFGVDDSPVSCETHVSSVESLPERTEIWIIPQEDFSEVYREHHER